MLDSELTKKLKLDLITYMKSKELEKLNVVRGILNEINIRGMKNIEIDDNEVIKVLRSELKKREESIESFQKAARTDLIEKETKEIQLIEQYLPKEISDEELFSKVKTIYNESKDKSFGTIMKAAVISINGQAGGKRIAQIVKKIIENK
ncbi:MAG: GatB/YqeY domain-containing protein [Endomicrobium sp.]|nr:GatB/YqeY domain-containing protein [Endomicrobium sp.]